MSSQIEADRRPSRKLSFEAFPAHSRVRLLLVGSVTAPGHHYRTLTTGVSRASCRSLLDAVLRSNNLCVFCRVDNIRRVHSEGLHVGDGAGLNHSQGMCRLSGTVT